MSARSWNAVLVAAVVLASAEALTQRDSYAYDVVAPRYPVTIDAELQGFAETPPGGTWRLPAHRGFFCDGLQLDGISFTRNTETGHVAIIQTYDVVVELRAGARDAELSADLTFVVLDGERELLLGKFTDIHVLAGQTTSVSETFSLNAHDLESFFGPGKTPVLRLTRVTRAV